MTAGGKVLSTGRWSSPVVVAFLLSATDNLILVWAYGLAFVGWTDRGLAWVFWTGIQGVLSLLLACLLGLALLGILLALRRVFRRVQVPSWDDVSSGGSLMLLVLYATYWLNSFAIEGPRSHVWRIDLALWLVAGFAALAVSGSGSLRRTALGGFHWRGAAHAAGFAVLASGAALIAARAPAPKTAAAPPQPAPVRLVIPPGLQGSNVLMVVIDAMRADRLSFSGHQRATTPHLDELARKGVVFRNARAAATRTSPAMASLLTGLTPIAHGIIESRTQLPRGIPTLSEAMIRLGYSSAAFLSNPNIEQAFGFTRGFRRVEESSGDDTRADRMVGGVERWLQTPKEPFFIWLHLLDPHAPYTPPPPFDRMFRGDALHSAQAAIPLPFDTAPGSIPLSARVGDLKSLGDYVCAYDGEVRFADEQLAGLLGHLQALHLQRATLTIITADHGESLGEHGLFFSHGLLPYDEQARVPLVFSHPALGHAVVEAPARQIDLASSILSLVTGKDTPFGDGRSLFPLDSAVDRQTVTMAGTPRFRTLALTSGSWKLVLRPRPWRDADKAAVAKLRSWPGPYRGTPLRHRSYALELYDLAADPGETRNLSDQRLPERRRLLDDLLTWIDRTPSTQVLLPDDPADLDEEKRQELKSLGYL